jgi:1,4-alpha-glucan branching enzyme
LFEKDLAFDGLRLVEFCHHAPGAAAVFVAGTFNEWAPDATPLHAQVQDGRWTGTIPLPRGRHEYKFVVDGEWVCDQADEHQYGRCPKNVPNDFGTMNCVLYVI